MYFVRYLFKKKKKKQKSNKKNPINFTSPSCAVNNNSIIFFLFLSIINPCIEKLEKKNLSLFPLKRKEKEKLSVVHSEGNKKKKRFALV